MLHNRMTLLHTAAINNKPVFIPLLLRMGVAINRICGDEGATALYIACMYGHTECVRALLQGGADVHAVCSRGATAAVMAALHGYTKCLEVLLEHAANFTDGAGRTLLHAAATGGRVQCMALLLSYYGDSGAAFNIDAVSALSGHSALSLCAQAPALELAVA
jgi:uncharacterized protein